MDKILFDLVQQEKIRQENTIELIASENIVSNYVMEVQGSVLTNKYAEGYPDKRYYGGCEVVDQIESLAISRVCELFGCTYANVQPHSGTQANTAVYRALLKHGDTVLGMDLVAGGHLTHGHPLNLSGKDYNFVCYNVDPITHLIDYDNLEKLAMLHKPKLIIAGASAYSREIDFKRFKEIATLCNAILMVDMAHIAGLIAAKRHANPFPHADVVTSTTHKTLRGPRGGIVLTNSKELIDIINKEVFPGIQGGPLMHVIGAKAVGFYENLKPAFSVYVDQLLKNNQAMLNRFLELGAHVITGGSDNHLFLLDVKKSYGITGKNAQILLDSVNITTNKNTIPYDDEKPFTTSGLRLGSAAMTSFGLKENDFIRIAELIDLVLKDETKKDFIVEEVKKIINK